MSQENHPKHFTEEQLGFGRQMIITERVPNLESRVAHIESLIVDVIAGHKCPTCGQTVEEEYQEGKT